MLSKRKYLSLTDEAKLNYIASIFNDLVDEEDLSEGDDEETSFVGDVKMSDTEDVAVESMAFDVAMEEANDEINDDTTDESDDASEYLSTNDVNEKYIARDGTECQKHPSSSHHVRSFNIVRSRCGPARSTEIMSKAQTL